MGAQRELVPLVAVPRGGGTPADYRAMWARYHDRYDRLGLDRDHVQWIFSASQTDWKSGACPAEAIYPGHRYVDWVGGTATPGPPGGRRPRCSAPW